MRILICDDSRESCVQLDESIHEYLQNKGISAQVDVFYSAEETMLAAKCYDLALVDIKMASVNGIVLSRYLLERNRNTIIMIVTSYDAYLDEAFDIRAFRFLSKPIQEERLFKSLDAAMEKYHSIVRVITLEYGSETLPIKLDDIVYIYIDDRKTNVVTTKRTLKTSYKMAYWRQALGDIGFSQPHNSYLVNLKYVTKLTKRDIWLSYADQLTRICVSQRKYAQFKQDFIRVVERQL